MRLSTRVRPDVFGVLVGLSVGLGLSLGGVRASEEQNAPRTVVVWVSVDGLRADYLDRGPSPFLRGLVEQGASSRELIPVFPSLTFPSHVSQATGAGAELHGIPSNSFYDNETGLFHRYPGDAALLEAEPIWLTAARQGLRVASLDWTLSHNQLGPIRTDYFDPEFDGRLSDVERLNRLLEVWRADTGPEPLRLLLGYGSGIDKAGHSFGPDAPEVDDAMRELDATLARFLADLLGHWGRTMRPDDVLYLLITTDHGMSTVHTMVDLDRMTGVGRAPGVVRISSGNLGHVFFTERDDPDRESKIDQVVDRVNGYDFASAYRREDLPERWAYRHPARVGDVVVVLESGFAIAGRGLETADDAVSAPVAEAGGPLGMHGYDPETTPEMLGAAILWRFPEPIGGVDLGPVHSLQLHATVARLLGIEPAATAQPDGIAPEFLRD